MAMLVAGGSALAAEPWEVVSQRDEVTLEVQRVPGSGFENVRVTGVTSATPRVVMKALWGVATDTTLSPEVVRREVLLDEAQTRRYYDVVHAPPASDRDYVVHEHWAEDDAGVITMPFGMVDDARKPVTPALVRFGKVEGTVTASPRPEGGASLTYVIFVDLGGALPAWLTRGPQREAARKFVLELRRRAEKASTP
jgi:hypothetical protein